MIVALPGLFSYLFLAKVYTKVTVTIDPVSSSTWSMLSVTTAR